MNWDVLSTVVIAVCCVLAIGATATTMEAAVDTTPDDAVDVDYRSMPIDGDTASQLKQQIQPGDSQQRSRRADPESEPRDETSTGQRDDTSSRGASGDGPSRGGEAGDTGAGQRTGPSGMGEGLPEQGADLLRTLFHALLAVLTLLVALVAVALAIRYRHRLVDAVRALAERLGLSRERSTHVGATRERRLAPPSPQNDVAYAWFVMVDRLGLSDRPSMTPRECASVAVDTGIDPDPVERLTRLFERVRYGGATVTDRNRSRSERALREILDQLPEGDTR